MTENKEKWRELENENEGRPGKDLSEMKVKDWMEIRILLWMQVCPGDSTQLCS